MASLPTLQRAPQQRSRASIDGPPERPMVHSTQSWKTELLPLNILYGAGGAWGSRINGPCGAARAEAGPEAGPEAGVGPEAGPEAGVGPEAGAEAGVEVGRAAVVAVAAAAAGGGWGFGWAADTTPGPIQTPMPTCWTDIGCTEAAVDLSIWPTRSVSSSIRDSTRSRLDITPACLSLATASWAGKICCMVSSAGVTTLANESSIRAANFRYSGQLKRESFHSGWSGNCLRKMTESCSRITLSTRSRRRNPVPARSCRTTSLSSRSGS